MLRPLKARAREMSRDLWASDAIFVDRAKSTTAQPTGFYGFALHTVELRVSETVGSNTSAPALALVSTWHYY